MKNRLLFEKIVQSIAPAVTSYHLELQLKNKTRDESQFTLHRDTSRYIAEDCADIAKAIVSELEQTRDRSRQASVEKIMGTISTAPSSHATPGQAEATAAGVKPRSSSNGNAHRSKK